MNSYPRVVLLSLHVPDCLADSAGVSYVTGLVSALSGDEVLIIAPDTRANRRSLEHPGPGEHMLIPVIDSAPGMLGALHEAWRRLLPLRPPPGYLEALMSDPRIQSALRHAEVIDLQWPPMTALVTRLRRLAPQARIVATPHDISSQRFARQASSTVTLRRRIRLAASLRHARYVERRQLTRADAVIVFSEKDAALLPDGVQVTVLRPPISFPSEVVHAADTNRPTTIIIGSLRRSENFDALTWLTSEIWPRVRASVPDAVLLVAGTADAEHRRRLVGIEGVDMLGFIDDVDHVYARADVALAPIRQGAGVKFKVLDALVRGLPVVTTQVGAEGIGDGEFSLPTFDDAPSFAKEVIRILNDLPSARSDADTAKIWARARFDKVQFEREVARVYGATSPTLEPALEVSPTVSIVIPVRNGEQTIGNELSALARQPEAATIEVVISDNGSTDRTREVVLAYRDAFADLRIVDSGDRAGVSHARNVGIFSARCEKVLICDADDEVRAGWISALSSALDDDDVVGGRTISSYVSGHNRALEPEQDHAPPERQVFGYLNYVLGGCMGVRRSAALSIGGFDETFVRGHEEVDFCWRLQQAGYTLNGVPNAVLDYRQRDRATDAARQRFYSARTRIQLWVRHQDRGELGPVSFKAAVRNAITSAKALPRLLSRSTRFSAARSLGWSIGTLDGHLRYRLLGSPPPPQLLNNAQSERL